MSLAVRIVILNYNGAEILPHCLPSIAEAARRSGHSTKVAVLDNQSSDKSLTYVAENFPEVSIERSRVNRVLCSYNDYLREIDEPITILLNNDIRVAPDFVDPLLEKFLVDPQTFLVAPRVMSFDGKRLEAGRSRAGFRFGLFWCEARYPGYLEDAEQPSNTFSSGFGAIDREKFLRLGGYDESYLPGIYEDVDLCLRAQRSGYHLYYEPTSVVYHQGQTTFKKTFGTSKLNTLAQRNRFLFMWKNFKGFSFWFPHILFLPLCLLVALLRGNADLLRGFVQALKITGRS